MADINYNLADEIEASARRGDRERAYQLTRVALIRNTSDSNAWVWMCRLVDDPARKRECLDRALALDPQNTVALGEQSRLHLTTLLQYTSKQSERPKTARRIGDHLVEQRIITNDQLDEALREQHRRRSRGDLMQLGDLLLQRGWLTPRTLARALVVMHQEKLALPGAKPQLLGEHLLAHALITPLQLEEALEEQLQRDLNGNHLPLGYILVRCGYITSAALAQVISNQRAAGQDHIRAVAQFS
ncbi:MAG: hypothetical protein SH847_10960 [Roseiflexaceae bacterium]|nr:hypothetical protein [Roseiflexaceae bacterium]